jgi:opacity protein-like surface antigen
MNRLLKLPLLATAGALLLAAPAAAQSYLSGAYTMSRANNPEYRGGTNFDLDSGHGALIAGGVTIGGYQLELEGSYRRNSIGGIQTPERTFGANGRLETYAVMANLIYGFDLYSVDLRPYVGVGAGYARVGIKGFESPELGQATVSDNDYVLAYQAFAGVSYQLTRSTDVFVAYRYFSTARPSMQDSLGVEFSVGRIRSQGIEVGLRLNFD